MTPRLSHVHVVFACIFLGASTSLFAASTLFIPVQRGEGLDFSVTIENTSSAAVASSSFSGNASSHFFGNQSDYFLTLKQPSACSLQSGVITTNGIQLSTGTIPGRSAVKCNFHVERSATSNYALPMDFLSVDGGSSPVVLSALLWELGPSTDLRVTTRQLDPAPAAGSSDAFVEVTVINDGPFPVSDVNVGFCQDVFAAPFTLDGDVPGGCLSATTSPFCFSDGAASMQFLVGAVEPNSTRSCRLHAKAFSPFVEVTSTPIEILYPVHSPNGELIDDPNSYNDLGEIVIALAAVSPAPTGSTWLVVLACLLLACALYALSNVRTASTLRQFARGRGDQCGKT